MNDHCPRPLHCNEQTVLDTLDLVPASIDDIIAATHLDAPSIQSALVTLELKGLARRLVGNRFVRYSEDAA